MADEPMAALGGPPAAPPAADAPPPATPDAAAAPAAPRFVEHNGERIALDDAYWDAKTNAPNIGALAKSQADLRRQVSILPKAPDTYDLAAGVAPEMKDVLSFDPADPLVGEASQLLKAANVPQDAAAKLVGWLAKREKAMQDGAEAREAEAAAKSTAELAAALGGDAEVAKLNAWITGITGGEAVHTTVKGALALRKLRDAIGEKGIPSATGAPGGAAALTEPELKKMQEDPRYWRDRDPAFMAQVADGYKRLYPE